MLRLNLMKSQNHRKTVICNFQYDKLKNCMLRHLHWKKRLESLNSTLIFCKRQNNSSFEALCLVHFNVKHSTQPSVALLPRILKIARTWNIISFVNAKLQYIRKIKFPTNPLSMEFSDKLQSSLQSFLSCLWNSWIVFRKNSAIE